MSVKGGYKILDLHDFGFAAGTAATVAGLHQQIEGAHRKPFLLSGIVLDGVEYGDQWLDLQNVSGTYTAVVALGASAYTFTVTAADAVTFTVKE